jgi:hypothetical protein
MFRKILACLLVVAALLTATSFVPGLAENPAYACDPDDPGCH